MKGLGENKTAKRTDNTDIASDWEEGLPPTPGD
jgi:hypothetical protein